MNYLEGCYISVTEKHPFLQQNLCQVDRCVIIDAAPFSVLDRTGVFSIPISIGFSRKFRENEREGRAGLGIIRYSA